MKSIGLNSHPFSNTFADHDAGQVGVGARDRGHDVRDEDVARLSPLGFDHINMLGRYAFTLPETVARGELRPLRDPTTARDDDG